MDSFRQVLQEASLAGRPPFHSHKAGGVGQKSGPHGINIGSSSTGSISPTASYKTPLNVDKIGFERMPENKTFHGLSLGRSDINRPDGKGLTILHRAASSSDETAKCFALALIAHPLVDLYVQDLENGWTALHRALYFGNITVARAIVERDSQVAIGQSAGISSQTASLVKVKDREGLGPFDILGASIADRTLWNRDEDAESVSRDDDEDIVNHNHPQDVHDPMQSRALVVPTVAINGDQLFTFGSNKNITLGFGDADDRHYPEQVKLRRPDHLFQRLYREHIEYQEQALSQINSIYADRVRVQSSSVPLTSLPSVIRAIPVIMQDIVMAKFHTVVLTKDPVSNLFVCGHGTGGRLGTGKEETQFGFQCLQDPMLMHRKVVSVALGQDHTLAVSDQGEIFSWGSNHFGQLGCGMPKPNARTEDFVQLVPKQLFGPLKKEVIIGVAASRIHSVAYTKTSIYTFGKNEGQLGLVDAHAGTLEFQPTPRSVAASRITGPIQSVCAIERATIFLLQHTHEVFVFANYGLVKLHFPLDGFANIFLQKSFTATNYDKSANTIVKITGGGDTIGALSSRGEVFTVNVNQRVDHDSISTSSVTNPNKIRAALDSPQKLWALKKDRMAARDVGVDDDGSVIINTEDGAVWRRIRRAKVATSSMRDAREHKDRDFKFSRVPNLTRVIAVRASASGAYCAVRQECNVTKTQISVTPQLLWHDMFKLSPFASLAAITNMETTVPRFWRRPDEVTILIDYLLQAEDLEKDIGKILPSVSSDNIYNFDLHVFSTAFSDVKLPMHQFILCARSVPFKDALAAFGRDGTYSSEMFNIQTNSTGIVELIFHSIDLLTVIELVCFAYTDSFAGYWRQSQSRPEMGYRYRQVRLEVMKVASCLDIKVLESAVRRMIMTPTPEKCLDRDMEFAVSGSGFFDIGDVIVQLEDGEVTVHAALIVQRCPFFKGLFQGRAGGGWLAHRRDRFEGPIEVDMKHVEMHVFKLVLRYIYADIGEELFDDVITQDLDEFLDVVMDVLSVANELMLDRLSQVCQAVLGRYVTSRNICSLLNAVAPSSETAFKDSGLEYLCLNLETMLSSHLLDELDEDLLSELDVVVRENQLACLPFAKSGRALELLYEDHPELANSILRSRHAKLDAIDLQMKLSDSSIPLGESFDLRENNENSITPHKGKGRTRSGNAAALLTPKLTAQPLSMSSPFATNGQDLDLLSPSGSRGRRPTFSLDDQAISSNVISADNTEVLQSAEPKTGSTVANGMRISSTPLTPNDLATGSLYPQSLPTSVGSSKVSTRPWGESPLQSFKIGMKEIMNQANASPIRTSSLSMGLKSEENIESGVAGPSTLRKSQKERKRQQQQRDSGELSSPNISALTSSPATPKSPWQAVSSRSSPRFNDEHKIIAQATPSPQSQASRTPSLTMRQTVSKMPASKEPSMKTTKGFVPTSPRQAAGKEGTKSIPTTSIQSIRHIPRPNTESSLLFGAAHHSLADIMSQEQIDKAVIKEAAAKRSLQEIQEEQAFQVCLKNIQNDITTDR